MRSLVLAEGGELGGYNPVAGYGELGGGLFYDGLLRLESTDPQALPALAPALAESLPTHDAALTTWRVDLRPGVSFTDGTALDARDVVATYRAVLDRRSASEIAGAYAMVREVRAVDGDTVEFRLRAPWADFASLLLLGIAPSERLAPGPAADSELNRAPVGTGPYRLERLTPTELTAVANPGHWRGAPAVQRLTIALAPDDNARAQRMQAGEIDGTSLPPALARTFERREGLQVLRARTADWRGVSLPRSSSFADSQAARLAMNLAVDRAAMVEAVLAGAGSPASTPVPPVYTEVYEPSVAFDHDLDRARQLLDEDGWRVGADGIRHKGGQRARFTLAHTPGDTVRRDLSTAFAADMRRIGVQVDVEALPWDRIEARLGDLAVLLAGGERPYSMDTQLHGPLHRRTASTTSPWDNPGGHGSPAVDKALDQARVSADADERTRLYRTAAREYLKRPSAVFLAFLDHAYVAKDSAVGGGPLVVEPHAHGIAWGPWWDLAGWARP